MWSPTYCLFVVRHNQIIKHQQEGHGQIRIKPWKPNDEILEKNKICTISFSVFSCYFLLRQYLRKEIFNFGLSNSFSNAQDLHKILSVMHNICARLYFSPQWARRSHHICTQHHLSAGHKIFYFLCLPQIDRSITRNKSNQM